MRVYNQSVTINLSRNILQKTDEKQHKEAQKKKQENKWNNDVHEQKKDAKTGEGELF